MRSVVLLTFLALAACQDGRPDRPDPSLFPDAIPETGLDEVVTSCLKSDYRFSAEARGFHPTALEGVGTASYTNDDGPTTTIVLQGCGRSREQSIGLSFHGAGPLQRGQYDVKADAVESGGFLFSYVDTTDFQQVHCAYEPTGSVTIFKAWNGLLTGRFDAKAKCIDGEQPDPGEYRETRFRGTFHALDVERFLAAADQDASER
jgi:hypothetical protein